MSFFLLPPQCLEGTSGTDLGLLRSNLSCPYCVAQIHIYGHVTLRRLCCQPCILQSLEYLIEVSEVLVLVKAENLHVVHVCPAYSLMSARSHSSGTERWPVPRPDQIGMMWNLYFPKFMLKAVFWVEDFSTGTSQYPLVRSIFDMNCAHTRLSISSSM